MSEAEAEPHVLAWHCAATASLEQGEGEVEKARESWAGCLEQYPTDVGVVSGVMSFHDAHGEFDESPAKWVAR